MTEHESTTSDSHSASATEDARQQQEMWQDQAKALRLGDPTAEDYATAYNQINQFLRDHGDPYLGRTADGSIYGNSGDPEQDTEKSLMRLHAAQPGQRLLEFGTGDGRLALAIARRGVDVTALDISEVAIETARAAASREPDLKIHFQQGSALETPFADASFDLVISADMVEHLAPAHVPVHLAEAFRILRPGGAYVLTLPCWVPEEEVDPLHLGNYHQEDVRRLLADAGFAATLFPLWVYGKTRRIAAVFPRATTWRARLSHMLAGLPVLGPLLARRTIRRWYGDKNFFHARKPSAE